MSSKIPLPDLSGYDVEDLIEIHEQVLIKLPNVQQIDLQQELVFQFLIAKELLNKARHDEETPLNQKSQVINSAASLLKQLADTQLGIYNSTRFRLMEQVLTETLRSTDLELAQEFLTEYRRRLESLDE